MKYIASARCATHSHVQHAQSLIKPSPWRMPRLTQKLSARRFYVNPRRAGQLREQ